MKQYHVYNIEYEFISTVETKKFFLKERSTKRIEELLLRYIKKFSQFREGNEKYLNIKSIEYMGVGYYFEDA